MMKLSPVKRFTRSRSGRGFLLHLAVCAILSAAVGYGFHYFSLNWFMEHKSDEKITALRLVDAFVTNYSAVRSQFGQSAPVPASFRAHAIDAFNKQRVGDKSDFRLRSVGRPGREILTPPTDARMAEVIEAFAATPNLRPMSELLDINGEQIFRTVYPTVAQEQSCVSCHNALQPGKAQWHLNDVIGAFVIDVPVSPFLRAVMWQSSGIGVGLFLALALAGLIISLIHFRQLEALDAGAAELRARDEDLQAQNMRFDIAINNMTQGLLLYDSAERLVVCNQRYMDMYGLSPDAVKPGLSFRDLIVYRKQTGSFKGDVDGFCSTVLRNVALGKVTHNIVETAGGRSIQIVNQPLADSGWLATHEDITERRQSDERIAHLAHYDALTDLPNRVLFNEQLKRELACVVPDRRLAVLYVDIDEFKSVNDSLGHMIGDELLKALAVRLRACVGEGDFVARLGGDEFAIVRTAVKTPDDVSELVTRVLDAIREPCECLGHQLTTDASIGIALAPQHGSDLDQILKNADLAMYAAKAAGRRTYRFFEPDMDVQVQARRKLEMDLRQAISDRALEVYYQPCVSLGDNRITGCEALLRWRHFERGMISPAEFIPIAEETGLINQLGEWVLTTACAEATTWPDDIRLAVNVSPVQLRSGTLALKIVAALAASGLPASRLELEITEAVLIRDDEAALAILHQLRAIGVRIALDDFGTGYSSLSYLQRFPFDKIKIDRCFVNDIAEPDGSSSIVQAVVNIAAARHMTTTAEGVETQQQMELLRALGCAEMQGYLFSPAKPAADIKQLFFSRSVRREAVA
jgi:diguanylate cyclase (GGDEF)-like protein